MSGFTSLTPGGAEHSDQAEASFWPSFTDIMMVVVMIFLLSSLVMFIRNVQLSATLSVSEEAERQARAEIRDTLSVNATLEEQLDYLQEALMQARLTQLRLVEQHNRQQRLQERQRTRLDQRIAQLEQRLAERDTRLASRDQALSALRQESTSLSEQLTEARERLGQRERRLNNQQQTLDDQRQRLNEQAERLAAFERREAEQQARQSELDQTIIQLQNQTQLTQADLSELQQSYQSLKTEYDKLVRPARSSEGKVVVSVRHYQQGGQKRYQIRDGNGWQTVSRESLVNRLSALKAEHSGDLYIKIVFPDNSGLEYSEAWAFTRDMLNQFDYYYQAAPVQ